MAIEICLVTSTRADWGLLRPVARLVRDDPYFNLSIVATGSHCSSRFGRTSAEIVADGFTIAHEVPILEETAKAADDARSVVHALAAATSGFGDLLPRLKPDLAIILGDRYEILGVTQACLLMGVPVAHLCGGDITEGAFDDAIRHAITKLSHVHFPSNADSGNRLIRMGEDPENVHVVGSTGLDTMRETQFLSRAEVFSRLGLPICDRMLLVTFHPPTLSEVPGPQQFAELAAAFDLLDPTIAIVLTGSNADPAGWEMTRLAEAYASQRANSVFRMSLGQLLYLSTMREASALVGNSSSGLYEAPSFGIATINIGDRQRGRLRAASVIDVAPDRQAICSSIEAAIDADWSHVVNPYGDGHSAPRIIAHLKRLRNPHSLLNKRFSEWKMP